MEINLKLMLDESDFVDDLDTYRRLVVVSCSLLWLTASYCLLFSVYNNRM